MSIRRTGFRPRLRLRRTEIKKAAKLSLRTRRGGVAFRVERTFYPN